MAADLHQLCVRLIVCAAAAKALASFSTCTCLDRPLPTGLRWLRELGCRTRVWGPHGPATALSSGQSLTSLAPVRAIRRRDGRPRGLRGHKDRQRCCTRVH